ncbi:hypothetical protein M3Y99_00731200 [Aphelenchoides fujianensis]|nr:hypothetical protein M3Y99_00731200 [Aphelenchoides fujianensis]
MLPVVFFPLDFLVVVCWAAMFVSLAGCGRFKKAEEPPKSPANVPAPNANPNEKKKKPPPPRNDSITKRIDAELLAAEQAAQAQQNPKCRAKDSAYAGEGPPVGGVSQYVGGEKNPV